MYTPTTPRVIGISGTALPGWAGQPVLLPMRLHGDEKLGKLYDYTLELKTANSPALPVWEARDQVEPDRLTGPEITITIEFDGKGTFIPGVPGGAGLGNLGAGTREITGLITKVTFTGEDDRHAYYEMRVRPWLWLATRNRENRIFENKSAAEITEAILGSKRYPFRYEMRLGVVGLRGMYPKRDFVRQLWESDFSFLARLWREWGIYYFMNGPMLVICDSPGGHKPHGNMYDTILYHAPDGARIDEEHIHRLEVSRELTSGAVSLIDYDPARSRARMAVDVDRHSDIPFSNAEHHCWGDHSQPLAGTMAWGVVRANRGMLVTTETRAGATASAKDMDETVARLTQARQLHEDLAQLARQHQAQGVDASQEDAAREIRTQHDAIRGSASTDNPFPEMTRPDLVVASAAGIATTAAESTHQVSQQDHAVTAGRDVSISGGRSLVAAVRGAVSLFAANLGMKLVAASGKVEVQAQNGEMALAALAKTLTLDGSNAALGSEALDKLGVFFKKNNERKNLYYWWNQVQSFRLTFYSGARYCLASSSLVRVDPNYSGGGYPPGRGWCEFDFFDMNYKHVNGVRVNIKDHGDANVCNEIKAVSSVIYKNQPALLAIVQYHRGIDPEKTISGIGNNYYDFTSLAGIGTSPRWLGFHPPG